MSTHPLEEILNPKSIAVVGARGSGAQGYDLYSSLLDYGYRGKIYPVNPKYSEILGIKVYPSLRDIPGSVDYAIFCIRASEVLNILADCSQKGVKAAHLYAAGFGETGRRESAELEQEILKQARKAGIRLIGPNCRGLYNPRQGISCYDTLPKESGSVALASQSGGGAREIIELAALRGVHFSKAISYGNALDLNECDFLDYLAQDPETKIILMYVEGVKDGKRFFNVLRRAASIKPVIIVKGGRGKSGARVATSHTASLTGFIEIWETLVTQAGAISAESFAEMVDLAVSFHFLPPIRERRVGIAGTGGGSCVLAADQCEEAGLDVIALPTEIREELKSKGISTWDWIGNPIDIAQTTADANFSTGDMLQIMARNQNFDLLIAIIGVGGTLQRDQPKMSAEAQLKRYKLEESKLKPLLAVVADESRGIDDYDNWKLLGEVRAKLIAANIPIYPTLGHAAKAARKLIDYYQKRGKS